MSQKEYARRQRVAPQLQRELTELIAQEFSDPRVSLATVTEVDMSPDLKSARVYISCMGKDPAPAVDFLNKVVGRVRHELGKRIRLRYMPQLRFQVDALPDRAAHINHLIRDAVAEDEQHHNETDSSEG